MISVAIADDHTLFRNSICESILSFGTFEIFTQAENGSVLIDHLNQSKDLPQMCILDISMPKLDGYETAFQLKKRWPNMKILMLSMFDNDEVIIRCIKANADGFLSKEASLSDFRNVLNKIYSGEKYFTESNSKKNINTSNFNITAHNTLTLREKEFLILSCSELTYKEIATMMKISPRTVDSFREGLFEKLALKSRIGLVLYALKSGIFYFGSNKMNIQ